MNLEQCLPCVEERRPYGEGAWAKSPRQGKLAARFLSGKTPNLENRFLFLQTAAAAHPLRQHIYLFFFKLLLLLFFSLASFKHSSSSWLAGWKACCEVWGGGEWQPITCSLHLPAPFFFFFQTLHEYSPSPIPPPPPSLSGKKIPSEI